MGSVTLIVQVVDLTPGSIPWPEETDGEMQIQYADLLRAGSLAVPLLGAHYLHHRLPYKRGQDAASHEFRGGTLQGQATR